jgi:hypothetical protein
MTELKLSWRQRFHVTTPGEDRFTPYSTPSASTGTSGEANGKLLATASVSAVRRISSASAANGNAVAQP